MVQKWLADLLVSADNNSLKFEPESVHKTATQLWAEIKNQDCFWGKNKGKYTDFFIRT